MHYQLAYLEIVREDTQGLSINGHPEAKALRVFEEGGQHVLPIPLQLGLHILTRLLPLHRRGRRGAVYHSIAGLHWAIAVDLGRGCIARKVRLGVSACNVNVLRARVGGRVQVSVTVLVTLRYAGHAVSSDSGVIVDDAVPVAHVVDAVSLDVVHLGRAFVVGGNGRHDATVGETHDTGQDTYASELGAGLGARVND